MMHELDERNGEPVTLYALYKKSSGRFLRRGRMGPHTWVDRDEAINARKNHGDDVVVAVVGLVNRT